MPQLPPMPTLRAPRVHPAASLSAAGPAGGRPALDLCSGQHRFGPPESVVHAAAEAVRVRLPGDLIESARHAVAVRFGVPTDQVLLGHGAADLHWSAARALASPQGRWLCVEPSVSSCGTAARAAGARVTQWRAVERSGYRIELDQVAELMRLVQPTVVSLSAPADPTGASVRWSALCALAADFAETLFIVDQSWLALSSDYADLEQRPPANVLCVRSLSVELGLAGLRAGYLLCAAPLAARIDAHRPELSISAPAAAAIACAMGQDEHVARCRSQLQQDMQTLRNSLDALELTHTPSVAPFALVRIARAAEFAEELLREHQIAVYPATSVGLPDHLRIAAPAAESCAQLESALGRVLERRNLIRGREP